ncbi:MAG TPA: hypothetical protein VFH16_21390, partial [Rubrobacter sp.]|nr:hypothetical protein [Rubrobacter sp.]
MSFANKPHLSTKTVPRPGAAPSNALSQAEFSVWLGAEELAELLATEMPVFNAPTSSDRTNDGEAPVQAMLSDGVTVRAVYGSGDILSSQLSVYDSSPNLSGAYLQMVISPSGEMSRREVVHAWPPPNPELTTGLARMILARLYAFRAVRFGIDENPIEVNRELAPDASNLVQVLDLLSRNTSRWQRYFREVRTVLPEI